VKGDISIALFCGCADARGAGGNITNVIAGSGALFTRPMPIFSYSCPTQSRNAENSVMAKSSLIPHPSSLIPLPVIM
ncbi:hypothetical protein MZC56_16250, partial [Yersinia pestis subsp. pestis]|nr:hypothetical protein [Yersinia pestis subsp. pestis]